MQEFDGAGSLLWRRSANPFEAAESRFAYDARGNLIAADNAWSRVRRQFDPFGRLVYEEQLIRGEDTTTFKGTAVYHSHDRAGRRQKTFLGNTFSFEPVCVTQPVEGDEDPVCPYGDDLVATDSILSRYDAAGRLTRIENTLWQPTLGTGPKSWQFQYDNQGRQRGLTLPTTTDPMRSLAWTYDGNGHLTNYSGAGLTYTIVPDKLGRVRQLNSFSSWEDYFDYDGHGRLESFTANHGAPSQDSYTYDLAGNRLTDTEWQYLYNDRGQLASKSARSGTARLAYQYDEDGNQTRWRARPLSLPRVRRREPPHPDADAGQRWPGSTHRDASLPLRCPGPPDRHALHPPGCH